MLPAPPHAVSRHRFLSAPSRFRVLALSLTLPGALAFAACDARRSPLEGRASDEWSRSYTLADDGEVQIVGAGGSIDVKPGTGSGVEVHAERTVRALSDASAAGMLPNVRINEEVEPDKVLLRVEGLSGIVIGAEVEVNFSVTVPPGARLRLRTSSGDITATDINGIVVASTSNGSIVGKALGGGVDARSANGNITMDLAAVSRDAVDLRAINGNITLTLPAASDANIEASCTNGTIDIEDLPIEFTGEQSRRRSRGRLNGGGTPVEATTTNGSIRIRPRQ